MLGRDEVASWRGSVLSGQPAQPPASRPCVRLTHGSRRGHLGMKAPPRPGHRGGRARGGLRSSKSLLADPENAPPRRTQRLSGSRATSSSRYRLWLMNETKQLPWLGRDNATRFLAVLGPSLGFCAHADRHERALRAHSECANSYSVGDNEPHGSHGRKRRSQPDSSNPWERRVIEHHETPRARRTATSPRAGRAGEGPHTSPRRPRGSQRLALHTEKLCPDKMT